MPVIKKIKRKHRLYRQFEADIWGDYTMHIQDNWIGRFLLMVYREKIESVEETDNIYRVDDLIPSRKAKKREWRFLRLKRLKLYYWFLGHKQFRNIDYKARRKEGPVVSHFIMFMESRLSVLVYRLYFVENIFLVRKFLWKQNLVVNKKIQVMPNARVWYLDVIQVIPSLESVVRNNVFKWIDNGFIYNYVPRYFFMNYMLMYGYVIHFLNYKI